MTSLRPSPLLRLASKRVTGLNSSSTCLACRSSLRNSSTLLGRATVGPLAGSSSRRLATIHRIKISEGALFSTTRTIGYAKKKAETGVTGIVLPLEKAIEKARSSKELSELVHERLFPPNRTKIPTDEEVVTTLDSLRKFALRNTPVMQPGSNPLVTTVMDETPIGQGMVTPPKLRTIPLPIAPEIGAVAYDIVTHPWTFISQPVLSAYTKLCVETHNLPTLPEIFHLYAHKPTTDPQSGKTTPQNPLSVRNAIPKDVADRALAATISSADIHLCLDLINESYATTAYRKNRALRYASPVFATAAMLPPLGYWLASKFAILQEATEEAEATSVAFWGIMGYFFSVGALGLISIAVRNDQMVRVSWEQGTGLFTRWLREDERAALDRVAMGWGFEQSEWRGSEEGEDWELLREWCGRREMVLDEPTLMPDN